MNPEWPEKIYKQLIPGSVLDLCCGGGRFYPLFTERVYTGVDHDKEAIKNAKKYFKHNKVENNWIRSDVAKWKPDRHYDNIFSWVALQHVKPSDIETVFNYMKEYGTNIIMCERTYDPVSLGETNRYLWTHDYKKHFPGLEMIESISGEVWLMHWKNNG